MRRQRLGGERLTTAWPLEQNAQRAAGITQRNAHIAVEQTTRCVVSRNKYRRSYEKRRPRIVIDHKTYGIDGNLNGPVRPFMTNDKRQIIAKQGYNAPREVE